MAKSKYVLETDHFDSTAGVLIPKGTEVGEGTDFPWPHPPSHRMSAGNKAGEGELRDLAHKQDPGAGESMDPRSIDKLKNMGDDWPNAAPGGGQKITSGPSDEERDQPHVGTEAKATVPLKVRPESERDAPAIPVPSTEPDVKKPGVPGNAAKVEDDKAKADAKK